MADIFKIFKNIFGRPGQLSVPQINTVIHGGEDEQKIFKAFGITSDVLSKLLADNLVLTSDFIVLCRAVEQSLSHPLMSSAVGAFADGAIQRSAYNQQIVWVETENKEYKYQIEKMFDIINLEEVLYDWCWTACVYGNMFVKVNGEKGVGIISVDDSVHPSAVSRVDIDGRLVGFYDLVQGYVPSATQLIPPYAYVHFRILQAKKRRGNYSQTGAGAEYRTSVLMGPDIRRATSKLGTSVLNDALPIYRRLKLTEDSILMARLTKGLKKYIYKVVIPEGTGATAASQLVDNYVDVLKSARAINTNPLNPQYQEKFQNMSSCVVGNTLVPLLDGNDLKISEIAENKDKYIGKYVYSTNPKTLAIEPDKIINVAKTRLNTEIVRVTLDNGKYVDCTPDHKFMLRDGSYKEAKDLILGQSLMPLYTNNDKVLLNHKVVNVEFLSEKQDVYDLTTEKNHNFALEVGIFVHNCEDIILPIWGSTNNFAVEEIGGDTADIKWIADLDELRNQLSCALKVPLAILGGYGKDENGNLNGTSAERNDIRFARQVRKVQGSIINGLTRMAQIHLAYLGMSPDLKLFKIRMAEVSTAEELEMQKGLGEAADTIDKLTDLIVKHTGEEIDKVELLNYFNQKMLKLEDLDIRKLMKDASNSSKLKTSIELPKPTSEAPTKANPFRESIDNSDLVAALPVDEGGTNKIWESIYRDCKVNVEERLDE